MRLTQTLLFFLTFVVLTASRCKKEKDNPVEQLPPETQTGANTFGCLVDGKVFKPKGDPFAGPVIKAQYQLVNGKQGFGISARRSAGETSQVVGIGGDSITIKVGVYELNSRNIAGKLNGLYTFSKISTLGSIILPIFRTDK